MSNPPASNPPNWTFTKVMTIIGVIAAVGTIGFACCRNSDKIAKFVKPASSPNPVVKTEVREEVGPIVQDPVQPAPATVLAVTNMVTVTNTVVEWRTNTVTITNPPVVYRQTNYRTEFVYVPTNTPAVPLQAGAVQVNIPPGTEFQSGSIFQVGGRDNFVGWHPGMNPQGGQQIAPSGAVPGTAGFFQEVQPGQPFALNKGQIAVIKFPNGISPDWKLISNGGNARILYNGLTEAEIQQQGGIGVASQVTIENVGDTVLLARAK